MSNSTIETFNQTASDFLTDLGMVFPDDELVAKALNLVKAACNINENSIVPLCTFLNGDDGDDLKQLNRTLFEIPGTHMEFLLGELNDENKKLVQSYVDGLCYITRKLEKKHRELNTKISQLRQGDTFQSMESILQNPEQLMGMLSNMNNLESMASALSQNAEMASILGQFTNVLQQGQTQKNIGNLLEQLQKK